MNSVCACGNSKLATAAVCRACFEARSRSSESQILCTRCGVEKPRDEFGTRGDSDRMHSWCKECVRAKGREWRRSQDPEAALKYAREWRIGHSEDEVLAIIEAQGGKCAICERELDLSNRRMYAVDHDHTCCAGAKRCGNCTRGVLCHRCNSVLGFVQDDPDLLLALAAYLVRTEETVVVR